LAEAMKDITIIGSSNEIYHKHWMKDITRIRYHQYWMKQLKISPVLGGKKIKISPVLDEAMKYIASIG